MDVRLFRVVLRSQMTNGDTALDIGDRVAVYIYRGFKARRLSLCVRNSG